MIEGSVYNAFVTNFPRVRIMINRDHKEAEVRYMPTAITVILWVEGAMGGSW